MGDHSTAGPLVSPIAAGWNERASAHVTTVISQEQKRVVDTQRSCVSSNSKVSDSTTHAPAPGRKQWFRSARSIKVGAAERALAGRPGPVVIGPRGEDAGASGGLHVAVGEWRAEGVALQAHTCFSAAVAVQVSHLGPSAAM
jgi:hypothetical protein